MHPKPTIRPYLWLALLPLLVGCGLAVTSMTPTPVDEGAISTQAAATVSLRMTQTAAAVTPTARLSPTATIGPAYTLSELRLAVANKKTVYTKSGDVYLKVGTNPELRLTRSGRDRDPLLSADGRKVVFYRGTAFDTVYSVDADGTHEKAIILSKSLPVLGRGELKYLTFRSGTHELLFNTRICEPGEHLYLFPACSVGIFLVDADTSRLTELVTGLSGDAGQGQNFALRPLGYSMSVADAGHIDLRALDEPGGYNGEILDYNILNYQRTRPNEFMPLQYWLPDSSALIAVIAASESNEPATPPHTYAVWRYSVDNKTAAQILLDPSVMFNSGRNFSVSPDRKWILYYSDGRGGAVGSLYIGNLEDGQVQSSSELAGPCPSTYYSTPQWSPDSLHFVCEYSGRGFVGSVDGSSTPVPAGGVFMDWVDSTHYLYQIIDSVDSKTIKTYASAIGGPPISVPDDFWNSP